MVVDVQHGSADPEGSLHVPGGDQVVDAVRRELEQARADGAFVVYTQRRGRRQAMRARGQSSSWAI
jgi:nicotinamidase-related amidase